MGHYTREPLKYSPIQRLRG